MAATIPDLPAELVEGNDSAALLHLAGKLLAEVNRRAVGQGAQAADDDTSQALAAVMRAIVHAQDLP